MGYMIANGFSKYDAYLGVAPTAASSVDAGVLSIRDFILSTEADYYVSCQGDHWGSCRGCFRAGSNIVHRIKLARGQLGKPSTDAWFSLKREDLPAAFLGR